MMFVLLAIAFVALSRTQTASAAECRDLIAKYRPDTAVTGHLPLDLDVRDIDAFADDGNWTAAIDVYANGKNAPGRGGSSFRKLRDYSLTAATNMAGMPIYEIYRAYWDSATFADDFIMAAAQGTGDFVGSTDAVRGECMLKGIQYQAVWHRVIREFEEAIDDCEESANGTSNYQGVHSLDEGWAVYAGSLEGPNGTSSGFMLWALAQKRCSQFGTCGNDGNAIVNKEILGHLVRAQLLIREGQCASAAVSVKSMIQLMAIPLIQGMLRYVHRGSTGANWSGTKTNYQKERAEGWAFTAAILPLIHSCSPAVATRVKNNLFFKANPYLKDGADIVVQEIQSVYPCLGLTCKQIGEMKEGSTVIYPMCQDASTNLGLQGSSAMTSTVGTVALVFSALAMLFAAM